MMIHTTNSETTECRNKGILWKVIYLQNCEDNLQTLQNKNIELILQSPQ